MKKLMKLAIIFFAISLCSCSVSAAGSKKAQAKQAYQTYLQNSLLNNSSYTSPGYEYYDINKDGVPELFFYYQWGVRRGCKIYTYRGGQVKSVKTLNGIGRISHKGKQISVMYSSGANVIDWTCFTFNGKKLMKKSKYSNNPTLNTSSWTTSYKYTKNGKRISEKSFYAALRKVQKWKYVI